MKRIAQLISWIALVGTIVPALMFFADRLSLAAMQQWLLGTAVIWFVATPLWMEHKATD
jgi:hypothetical protein